VVNQFTRGLLEPELQLELDKDSRPAFRLGVRRNALLGMNTQMHKPGHENVRMRFVLTDDKELSRPTLVTSSSLA
jgi:predicted component of type VI protein secretion system